jgi:uncharacterized protein with NRDE domain
LAFYFNMNGEYPLVVAANRDEHYDRPSAAPQMLPGLSKILAGRDLRAGGTWLGVNEYGLVAGILNRRLNGDQIARSNARSRGLLCMDLLAQKTARDGRASIADHKQPYNPFTLMFADRQDAFIAYNMGAEIVMQPLESGLHVFSSAAEVDVQSVKADRARDKFAAVPACLDPAGARACDWVQPLQQVLSDHFGADGSNDPADAICVHRENSGTVSSSIIVYSLSASRLQMFHSAGAPCRNSFVNLSPLELNDR